MKTAMIANDYHSSITAGITPAQAFEHISDVSGWWATDFEGHSKKTGDIFTVRFGKTFVTFQIAELVPGKRIAWLVMDCNIPNLKDAKEWNGTSVLWEVSDNGGSTRIDMTHIGLVPEVECFDMCEKGWNHFVKESLFKLLTEGEGLPR